MGGREDAGGVLSRMQTTHVKSFHNYTPYAITPALLSNVCALPALPGNPRGGTRAQVGLTAGGIVGFGSSPAEIHALKSGSSMLKCIGCLLHEGHAALTNSSGL